MPENAEASDPFGDFVGLLAAPLAAGIRSVEQMRHATDEFVRGMENFNRTMENLNATAERVNRLLDDIEGPARALLPQLDRTVQAADDLTTRIGELPVDPAELVNAIVELSHRMAPLAQMAESASGMFGLRIPGFGGPGPDVAETPPGRSSAATGEATPAKKAPSSTAKKASSTTAEQATKATKRASSASKRATSSTGTTNGANAKTPKSSKKSTTSKKPPGSGT